MKRIIALLLTFTLLMSLLPGVSLAKGKKMQSGVPVWDEETVRQYALDYVEGTSMSRLWNYYDLQIRRYMPIESYEAILTNLEWMTGEFIGLGTYRSFEEPDLQLKTHVLHLCMEKQDLDMYFTHKNEPDDWEIMALEFVPADKQTPISEDDEDMLVDATKVEYTEENIQIGNAPYLLDAVITWPEGASEADPVPACVLVHDFGAMDKDHTLGQTHLFKDIAELFAGMGIATIRYDKRTCAYPDYDPESLWDEVIEDAIAAGTLMSGDARVDSTRVVMLGVGLGAMIGPRVGLQAEGVFTALLLVNGSLDTVLEHDFQAYQSTLSTLSSDEAEEIRTHVAKLPRMKENKAREITLMGHNGYYYWDDLQYKAINLIKKLKMPIRVICGKKDPVGEADSYVDKIGTNAYRYISYQSFRGLNHLLMNDLSVDENGVPQYPLATTLNKQAGRAMAQWILSLNEKTKED